MMKYSRLAAAALALALSSTHSAEASRQLGAASDEILTTYAQVVVGRALEKLEDGRVRFSIVERFHGKETANADVLVNEDTYARVEVDQQYLVAYSRFRKNPLLRDVVEPDPRGAVAVSTTLVGEFVLADRPATRRLLAGAAKGKGSKRAQARAAITLLAGDDLAATRFAAMELYGRETLRSTVATRMSDDFAVWLRAGAVDPQAQEFLFRAARRSKGERSWLASGARDVLDALELPLDPVSPLPSLALTAMEALADTGTADDAVILERFVAARNPGVAKMAIRSMDRIDRAHTLVRANAWINDSSLLEETRRSLHAYISKHEE